jgi:hypothetical protein
MPTKKKKPKYKGGSKAKVGSFNFGQNVKPKAKKSGGGSRKKPPGGGSV